MARVRTRTRGVRKGSKYPLSGRPDITTVGGKTYTWEEWHEKIAKPTQLEYGGIESAEDVLTPSLKKDWDYYPVGGEDGLVERWVSKDGTREVEVVPIRREEEQDEEGNFVESYETDYLIYPKIDGRVIWNSPEIKSGDDLSEGKPGALRFARRLMENFPDRPNF